MPDTHPLVSYDLLWQLTLAAFVIAPAAYVVAGAVRDWWRGRSWWSTERRALDALGRRDG